MGIGKDPFRHVGKIARKKGCAHKGIFGVLFFQFQSMFPGFKVQRGRTSVKLRKTFRKGIFTYFRRKGNSVNFDFHRFLSLPQKQNKVMDRNIHFDPAETVFKGETFQIGAVDFDFPTADGSDAVGGKFKQIFVAVAYKPEFAGLTGS